MLLGIVLSDYKVNKIYDSERELMTNFLFQDVETALISNDPCKFSNSSLVSTVLFNSGDRLISLEKDLGKNDVKVISLKKYYTILQVKDFLFYKKVAKQCDTDIVLNLFFYSNDPKKCEKCEDQGFVLTYLRAKYPNVRTYSFDVDLNLSVVDHLKELYGVTKVPSVVFDEDVYSGFVDNDRAEEIIKRKIN